MRAFLLAILLPLVAAVWARAADDSTYLGKTANQWIVILHDEHQPGRVRRQAIWVLGHLGPKASASVPDLIVEVRKGPLRRDAIDSLVLMGAGAEATVPVLIEQFKAQGCAHLTATGAIGFSRYEEYSFARIGRPAVPPLLQLLTGPNTEMRPCAAEALGIIGPPAREAVPLLVRAIEFPEQNKYSDALARAAVQALGQIGPDAKAAIPALERSFRRGDHPDYELVMALDRIGSPPARQLVERFLREGDSESAYFLQCLGPHAKEAAPALRRALADRRLQVRISAAAALAHVDPTAADAEPALIEGLKHKGDEDLDVLDVEPALAQLGPRASAALPIMVEQMTAGRDDSALSRAVVQVDPEGRQCVPGLIRSLKSDESDVVNAAAWSAGLLHARATAAVPALAAVLSRRFDTYGGDEMNPRVNAARALRRIGPAARGAAPALIEALKPVMVESPPDAFGGWPDYDAAAAAAETLGALGADASAAVPALIRVIQTREKDDATWQIRQECALALGRIGPAARSAIPALRALLKEGERDERYGTVAAIALLRLSPDGRAVAEQWLKRPLRGLLIPGAWYGLGGRAMLLGAMGRTSPETDWVTQSYLEALDRRLAEIEPIERGIAEDYLEGWISVFARLGPSARLAVPRLRQLCSYPNPWVRMWAEEALARIMPEAPRKSG